jgi:hypothetical protein
MSTNERHRELTDDLLIRYLLGELEEPDRIRIQESLFSDDDVFNRLLEAEDDLVDRYARGELAGPERELFERAVLPRESTRQRLIFARALAARTSSGVAPAHRRWQVTIRRYFSGRGGKSWYRLAAAAALLVTLGVAVWLALNKPETRPQQTASNGGPAEQQTPAAAPRANASADSNRTAQGPPISALPGTRNGKLSEQQSKSHQLLQTGVATLVLYPGSTRSGEESQQLSIESTTREVALRLQLDEADEYRSYGAVVRTARGSEILRNSGLVPARFAFGKAVTVEVTAGSLAPGRYEIELSGHQDNGSDALINYYYFTVSKAF